MEEMVMSTTATKLNADGKEIRDWSNSPAQNTSFENGRIARREGKPVTDCPFGKGRGVGGHRNAWLDGYAVG
jgi:hypothetical protein